MKATFSFQDMPEKQYLEEPLAVKGGHATDTIVCSRDSSAVTYKGSSVDVVICGLPATTIKAPQTCPVKVIKAFGVENWDYPDPRCIFAPEIAQGLAYE